MPAKKASGSVSLQPAPKDSKKPKKKTIMPSEGGRPRRLSFTERIEAWEAYVVGATIFEIARDLETSPFEVSAGLQIVAKELGFPHDHLDPELERFRIIEASDRMKSAVVKLLSQSNSILKVVDKARAAILEKDPDLLHMEPDDRKDWLKMVEIRQGEMKVVNGLFAEFRAINMTIADLAGVRKTKPKREPRKVQSMEDIVDQMSDEELRQLTQGNADGSEEQAFEGEIGDIGPSSREAIDDPEEGSVGDDSEASTDRSGPDDSGA